MHSLKSIIALQTFFGHYFIKQNPYQRYLMYLDRNFRPTPLASGGFGTVYLAYDQKTQKEVVIKKPNANGIADIKNEGRILKNLQHPGIPALIESAYQTEGLQRVPVLVEEAVAGRDIWTINEKYLNRGTFRDKIPQYLAQLLSILHYMHSKGIAHLDLHPGNVMITDADVVYLIDYGASKDGMTGVTGLREGERSNFRYMDPDAAGSGTFRGLRSRSYGMAVDYYGVALVLHTLITADNHKLSTNMRYGAPSNHRWLTTGNQFADELIKVFVSPHAERWNLCFVSFPRFFAGKSFFSGVQWEDIHVKAISDVSPPKHSNVVELIPVKNAPLTKPPVEEAKKLPVPVKLIPVEDEKAKVSSPQQPAKTAPKPQVEDKIRKQSSQAAKSVPIRNPLYLFGFKRDPRTSSPNDPYMQLLRKYLATNPWVKFAQDLVFKPLDWFAAGIAGKPLNNPMTETPEIKTIKVAKRSLDAHKQPIPNAPVFGVDKIQEVQKTPPRRGVYAKPRRPTPPPQNAPGYTGQVIDAVRQAIPQYLRFF